ncbi:hypothetical protein CE91St59_26640 [[Clostridium] scindens]|nr:hypothetical protein CE91St59_26640 [[Clostridium] scindens]BDF21099.1 hypothetical protein CE91St60_26820 [[Clostridium] scindens]
MEKTLHKGIRLAGRGQKDRMLSRLEIIGLIYNGQSSGTSSNSTRIVRISAI